MAELSCSHNDALDILTVPCLLMSLSGIFSKTVVFRSVILHNLFDKISLEEKFFISLQTYSFLPFSKPSRALA